MSVPEIHSDSESVAPDYPSFEIDGVYYRVDSPSELGVRNIQLLMRLANKMAPVSAMLRGDVEDGDVSEDEYEEGIRAARMIVQTTSEIPAEKVNELSELEVIGYVNAFLGELTDTISGSRGIRFR